MPGGGQISPRSPLWQVEEGGEDVSEKYNNGPAIDGIYGAPSCYDSIFALKHIISVFRFLL